MSGAFTSEATEAIAKLVSERTGFTYALQHPHKTEEGIRRAMARRGEESAEAYRALLAEDPGALDQLMDELTIRETYFFREPRHFDFIREEILPAIRARGGAGATVRAWSAGCASGEEAYSLAILLAQSGALEDGSVLGTDISQAALSVARDARYRDWSLRGASPGFLAQYFRTHGPSWELIEPIRRHVRFSFLNLALDAYPSHLSGTHAMDLILCRNVLIYFDAWTIEQVSRRLVSCLSPGGWLVTASSDPTLGADIGLEPHITQYGVFYRRPLQSSVRVESPPPRPPAPAVPQPPPPPRVVDAPAKPIRAREPDADPCVAAQAALREGDYERVLALIPHPQGSEDACRLHVDALANRDGPEDALLASVEAVRLHPLCTALHFRQALLLSSLGRLESAEEALRRVLYLDRGLAVAHFALASLLWRERRTEAARRSFRIARRLCLDVEADEELELGDGQTAADLASAAARHLGALGEGEAIPA